MNLRIVEVICALFQLRFQIGKTGAASDDVPWNIRTLQQRSDVVRVHASCSEQKVRLGYIVRGKPALNSVEFLFILHMPAIFCLHTNFIGKKRPRFDLGVGMKLFVEFVVFLLVPTVLGRSQTFPLRRVHFLGPFVLDKVRDNRINEFTRFPFGRLLRPRGTPPVSYARQKIGVRHFSLVQPHASVFLNKSLPFKLCYYFRNFIDVAVF